jgi:glycerol-3-phosphate dehydrogenase
LLPGGSDDYQKTRAQLISRRPEWLAEDSAEWLLKVYGARARDVVKMAEKDGRQRERIVPDAPAIAAVIPFSFEKEFARNLPDVMLRRTMLALEPDAGLQLVEAASRMAAESQGWDEQRRQAEVQAFRDQIALQLPAKVG